MIDVLAEREQWSRSETTEFRLGRFCVNDDSRIWFAFRLGVVSSMTLTFDHL